MNRYTLMKKNGHHLVPKIVIIGTIRINQDSSFLIIYYYFFFRKWPKHYLVKSDHLF